MSRSLAILKKVAMIKTQCDEDQERRKFMSTPVKGTSLGTIFNAQNTQSVVSVNPNGNHYYHGLANAGSVGSGYVTVASTAASQGYYHLANQVLSVNGTYQTQPAVYIPSPSGQMVSVQFVDAIGQQYQLLVDNAYAMLMQQITYQHQASLGIAISITPTSPPHQKMLEGDFSPEEMEKAAQVIEEMGGDLAELH